MTTLHADGPRDRRFSADEAFSSLLGAPGEWAVFLDIDGCLLDLAPTPDAIVVPADLPGTIERLRMRLGGALALVTGRGLGYADTLFDPFPFPIAGLHGAEMRGADGRRIEADAPPAFAALKAMLVEEARSMPGVLVEDKGAAVAAHYRLAPQFELALGERMRAFADAAGPDYALQLGKMVYEIRPARASKGDAVERFLRDPPFAGRLPLALGDDLTDESMFAVANARGGLSFRVGRPDAQTCAQGTVPSPANVRALIARAAG
ncbi:MAG: trehalose-phosphatase [Rhizobiaceae bacterium]|nr:trehalose-phosphatase [Rhizobiaceae bacterium]